MVRTAATADNKLITAAAAPQRGSSTSFSAADPGTMFARSMCVLALLLGRTPAGHSYSSGASGCSVPGHGSAGTATTSITAPSTA
eukprot:SAG22_NODE_8448_length_655_cov_1.453237_1_plen_84_part_10